MKKVLIGVVLGLMIVVVGVTSYFIGTRSSASKAEKLIYFDEPEEAIMKFVESVNDADMPGIKEAFGIAVKTEGFDYGKYAEVLKSISPMAGMPEGNELFREMNEIYFATQVYSQLKTFFMILNTDAFVGMTYIIDISNSDNTIESLDQDLDDFIADYEDIQEIEVIGIYRYTEFDDDERHQENMQKRSKPFGAENSYDCALVFEYDRNDYVLGITVYEYDEGYIISSLNSVFLDTGFGIPSKLDDDWEDLIDDECEKLY